jgi:hypothetical protein
LAFQGTWVEPDFTFDALKAMLLVIIATAIKPFSKFNYC